MATYNYNLEVPKQTSPLLVLNRSVATDYKSLEKYFSDISKLKEWVDITAKDKEKILQNFHESVFRALKTGINVHSADEIKKIIGLMWPKVQPGTAEILVKSMEKYSQKEIAVGNNLFRRPDMKKYEWVLGINEHNGITIKHKEYALVPDDTDISLKLGLTMLEAEANLNAFREEEKINSLVSGRVKEEISKEKNKLIEEMKVKKSLQYGLTQEQVKDLQAQLGVVVDGIIGKKTRAAIRNFQKQNHLKVDGIVGKQTLEALEKQKNTDNADHLK